VTTHYVTIEEARAQHGLIRSKSVAPPPTPDGRIRVIEIAGLDRQACGGTHLTSTGALPATRILKVDNKGRHNRRIRIGLATSSHSDARVSRSERCQMWATVTSVLARQDMTGHVAEHVSREKTRIDHRTPPKRGHPRRSLRRSECETLTTPAATP
jgi:alanyl-tRNA synthetase